MSSGAELDGQVAEVRAALQQARAEIGKRVSAGTRWATAC